jgi:hypothetical protein
MQESRVGGEREHGWECDALHGTVDFIGQWEFAGVQTPVFWGIWCTLKGRRSGSHQLAFAKELH